MHHDTTEYSDALDLFLTAAITTKNSNRGRKLNTDYLRDCMNIQTQAFQTYVRKAYGLSLSEADFIIRFPLPEGVERIYFLLEILDLADKVCFHRIDSIILSNDRKSELMKLEGKIPGLTSSGAENYLYGEGYKYSFIRSGVWAVLYRLGLSPAVPASGKLITAVEKLASIIACDLDRDRVEFSFHELTDVINAVRLRKGLTKDALAYRVKRRHNSQVKALLDGKQKSTGLTMIDEIATALDTTTTLLYEEAEKAAANRRKGKNTPAENKNAPAELKIIPFDLKISVPGKENAPAENEITPAEKKKPKVPKSEIPLVILRYCSSPRSILEIGSETGYRNKRTLRKYIAPLLSSGKLLMTTPERPTSPNQKYVTAGEGEEKENSRPD